MMYLLPPSTVLGEKIRHFQPEGAENLLSRASCMALQKDFAMDSHSDRETWILVIVRRA
jgi:hypothetical protein